MVPVTQGERLARIETILDRIEKKLDKVEADTLADIADLAKLKNRGAGILIGVSIAAASLGATATTILRWVGGLFN